MTAMAYNMYLFTRGDGPLRTTHDLFTQAEFFAEEANKMYKNVQEFSYEVSETWDEYSENDIVKRAKTMTAMAYNMYLFTRGDGPLRTTHDLFTQAEFFAEEANKMYKNVQEFSYEVSETWDEYSENDIVKRAKTMTAMAYNMYLFTRGDGPLRTTHDLFTQAEFFAEEANKMYKNVQEFSYEVSETWDEYSENDIVKRAKTMTAMAYNMYLFTRGDGPFRTTHDLFTQAEFFAEEANKMYKNVQEFSYEVSETWDEYSENDIVKRAKTMTAMAYNMYLFTRGDGPLRTTHDLFTQAEFFAEEANKMYKNVQEFSYEVPGSAEKNELLIHLEKIPACCQALQVLVKGTTVGKVATFNKVDSVISETKNLMNEVSKLVTNCFVCATKYEIEFRGGTMHPVGGSGAANPHETEISVSSKLPGDTSPWRRTPSRGSQSHHKSSELQCDGINCKTGGWHRRLPEEQQELLTRSVSARGRLGRTPSVPAAGAKPIHHGCNRPCCSTRPPCTPPNVRSPVFLSAHGSSFYTHRTPGHKMTKQQRIQAEQAAAQAAKLGRTASASGGRAGGGTAAPPRKRRLGLFDKFARKRQETSDDPNMVYATMIQNRQQKAGGFASSTASRMRAQMQGSTAQHL